MRNAYVDLCLQIQATRREYEGIRTPLAPAMGVAASLYTHQLANVYRVLTDVRVRHLLADEVGLGKTVQALMVLNALRAQRSDLQALVVVPDRLDAQWRDEITTRAHRAPFGEQDGAEGSQYIRLAWEAQLRAEDEDGTPRFALSEIDPSRYDVLVVDELHRLRGDVQDRIVRVAGGFQHLLVLTATPAFQHVERHAQLFALLEPERTALSRWRVTTSERGTSDALATSDDLSKWPSWAAGAVVEDLLQRDNSAAMSASAEALPSAALAHCAYRRVIRTRRVDYSGVLPRRRHKPIVVEPLGAEVDRQSLMWQYFGYLDELSRRFDPVLLAKRVVLSPPSLEQRVDFLRRKGHERAGLLEQVKPMVHRSQGDSRADALVDLLASIWAEDPTERVLVAAQDNLTVDYLDKLVCARLPEVGPLGRRRLLKTAVVRQGQTEEMCEDLGDVTEFDTNVDAFQRGDALVLFAPEKGQVGLNLQRARILVLYSVPWRPEEVEQWIGRIDRIGNAAAFSTDGSAKALDIYTIAQRGLVDEKVVAVLQRFHAFERSINLDGDHLEEVATLIEDAALRPERVSWAELEQATEQMAAEDELQELDSALREHLPWTVKMASRVRQHVDSLPPAPPVLKELPEHSALGPKAWDRALEGMLKLLSRAGDYHIRWNTDPESGSRFRTLWYRFGGRKASFRSMFNRLHNQRRADRKELVAPFVFSFDGDPGRDGGSRSPKHAHAFVTRRGDIGTLPRRDVTLALDDEHFRRPLRFLNFGDALHDELLKGWAPKDNGLAALDVVFFEDHALCGHRQRGLYLLRVSIIDPASALLGRGVKERTLEAVARAATRSEPERLPDLMCPFSECVRCALEADVRWLRGQLTANMAIEARRRDGDRWVSVEAEETAALLNPMAHQSKGVPRASELRPSESDLAAVERELERQRQGDETTARQLWSHRLPDFSTALHVRLMVVKEEGRDAVAVATEELRRAEDALEVATGRGNRAQITRAENALDAAADTQEMVRAYWEERACWLRDCKDAIRQVRPREQLTALIRARRVT